eukprot:1157471-Pelagomonas_calceolata.AAC.9
MTAGQEQAVTNLDQVLMPLLPELVYLHESAGRDDQMQVHVWSGTFKCKFTLGQLNASSHWDDQMQVRAGTIKCKLTLGQSNASLHWDNQMQGHEWTRVLVPSHLYHVPLCACRTGTHATWTSGPSTRPSTCWPAGWTTRRLRSLRGDGNARVMVKVVVVEVVRTIMFVMVMKRVQHAYHLARKCII